MEYKCIGSDINHTLKNSLENEFHLNLQEGYSRGLAKAEAFGHAEVRATRGQYQHNCYCTLLRLLGY